VKDAARLEELLKGDGRKLLEVVKHVEDQAEIISNIWRAAQQKGGLKSLQKSAKKALYVLRSGGIDVDRYKPVRESGKQEKEQDRVDTTLLSVPDGLGHSQLVIALLNKSSAALTLYRFVMHSLSGVVQFSAKGGSRKLLQKLRDDRYYLTVPPTYALYRLSLALDRTDRAKISGLSALPPALQAKQPRVEHPVHALAGTRLTRIVKPAEDRELFSQVEVGDMTLPKEDIGRFREEMERARESRLVIQGMTPEERVRKVMQRFFHNYFTPERLADLSLRLLDTALAFHYRGMQEYTKLLIDYAENLLSPNLVPDQHPLLGYLIYKTFMNR
jgi:hypothetical protein